MVKIKHKQTKELSEVTISIWLRKINQDLYDVVSYKDVVSLYQNNRNKEQGFYKLFLGIVEKEHAERSVKEHPNEFSYEIWTPEPTDTLYHKNKTGYALSDFKKSVLNIMNAITPKAIKSLNSIWKFIILIVTGVLAKVIVELIANYLKN
ncbi:hypothetical protein EWM62_13760 [Mucilaginibacter terrigena]|uniref:Uncharacterized protein n=1 Tax=Mucilaginibacter terrigena TaxID=2492395 RepID=A0A4Q5LKN8_9SPHI|nr:hypothetical protein [Mucilaginibacter terrigena]RYU89390.1 hypothetical protein EWM62_13760 [Mucilaginibacter terrigena]